MPFLAKVEEAANQLADPAARAELQTLMAGETARWERIRALLSGAPGQRPAPTPSPAPEKPAPPSEVRPPNRLTVGSLRGQR